MCYAHNDNFPDDRDYFPKALRTDTLRQIQIDGFEQDYSNSFANALEKFCTEPSKYMWQLFIHSIIAVICLCKHHNEMVSLFPWTI